MISEIIEKWIKGILIDGITGNLSGLFDNVNAKVGEIASDVGSTPQAWNSGIFNMLRNLSETVVLPIAAAILALVMCHELIQMITEKNNMHDFDTSMFFRWIFKSAFAILIVSNTWNIVMGVFDATQSVVNQSSGVIIGETSIHFDRLIPGLEFQLESMTIGSLLSLWFQTLVVGLTMNILSICIFLVTYGRMIEIYVVTALGPIPLATMGSSEWRSTGQNYLKSLLALGFQAFLIMIVVGIYAVLIRNISGAADIAGAIWGCMGYTVSALLLSVQDRQHQQVRVRCPLRKERLNGVCDRSQRFDPCKIQSLIRADQAAAGLLRRCAPHGRTALFFGPELSFQQCSGPADDFCHAAGAAVRSVRAARPAP